MEPRESLKGAACFSPVPAGCEVGGEVGAPFVSAMEQLLLPWTPVRDPRGCRRPLVISGEGQIMGKVAAPLGEYSNCHHWRRAPSSKIWGIVHDTLGNCRK
jgi:hypothetical protein